MAQAVRTYPEWFTSTHRVCRGCGEYFVGQRAFDMHQWDDGRSKPCKAPSEWQGVKLFWSERKNAWRQRQPGEKRITG